MTYEDKVQCIDNLMKQHKCHACCYVHLREDVDEIVLDGDFTTDFLKTLVEIMEAK